MKFQIKQGFISAILLCIFATLQIMTLAQDTTHSSVTTTHTTTTETSDWYTQPWVWIAGGAVFILLLVALIRGNSSSSNRTTTDRVTVTKTRDTDV